MQAAMSFKLHVVTAAKLTLDSELAEVVQFVHAKQDSAQWKKPANAPMLNG